MKEEFCLIFCLCIPRFSACFMEVQRNRGEDFSLYPDTQTSRLAHGAENSAAVNAEPAGRPIPTDPEALLFGSEMAYLLGLSVRTLESLRVRGDGPPFIKLGRAVRYRRSDGLMWAALGLRRSTSDLGETA